MASGVLARDAGQPARSGRGRGARRAQPGDRAAQSTATTTQVAVARADVRDVVLTRHDSTHVTDGPGLYTLRAETVPVRRRDMYRLG